MRRDREELDDPADNGPGVPDEEAYRALVPAIETRPSVSWVQEFASLLRMMESEGLTDRIISVGEAASRAGLSRRHLQHLLKTGRIPGRKLERDWMVTWQDVDAYLKQRRKPGRKPKAWS